MPKFHLHYARFKSLSAKVRSAGAHGYVQKSQASRDLVDAMETLLQGGTFFKDSNGKES